MTSLYDRWILPKILRCACSAPQITKQREKVVPQAEGRVLELGIGMGLNLAFYDAAKVSSVTGVDPSPELRAIAQQAEHDPRIRVQVDDGTAESLPFEDRSFDSVVCTFTLCSVCTPAAALSEARRVLKPGGSFLFCEHGLAPDPGIAKWQRRLDGIWPRVFGGCHLSRPVTKAIQEAGFKLERTDSMFLPKVPGVAGWNEWGLARP